MFARALVPVYWLLIQPIKGKKVFQQKSFYGLSKGCNLKEKIIMTEAWFFMILDGSRSHSALIITRTFGPSMHLIIKKKKRQNNNIIVAILEFLRLLILSVVG